MLALTVGTKLRRQTGTRKWAVPLACTCLLLLRATPADALTIEILDIGDSGVTADGTVFEADPNPTSPSTGTGVFEPFVRIEGTGSRKDPIQNGNLQLGFNSDAKSPDINFDTKNGSDWTRSIMLGEVGTVQRDGITFLEFSLDANEEGRADSKKNQIDIIDVQIYVSSNPSFADPESSGLGVYGTGYTGTPFDSTDNSLLGVAPVWTLDSAANGDVTVILQASICDSNGQCGSGKGDLSMLIPLDLVPGDPGDFLVFYTEYARAADPSGGFEEWRTQLTPVIPEPRSLLVFLTGLAVVAHSLVRRARTRTA